MLTKGEIVPAEVVRIVQYGVYLRSEDNDLLVLAVDVSWKSGIPIQEVLSVGDRVNVLVKGFSEAHGLFVGSIKHTVGNPYHDLSVGSFGGVFKAKVIFSGAGVVRIELPNGARGELPAGQGYGLKEGIMVSVRLLGVDQDAEKVLVEIAG